MTVSVKIRNLKPIFDISRRNFWSVSALGLIFDQRISSLFAALVQINSSTASVVFHFLFCVPRAHGIPCSFRLTREVREDEGKRGEK